MKHISVYLLFAVAIPSFCCADVTKLSPEDRKVLQDSSRFHEVYSTGDLPPASSRFAAARSQSQVRSGTRLIRLSIQLSRGKRLIWAAVGGDYYVVHYERGRIAHTFYTLVAKLAKDEAKLAWSAVGLPFKDYAAFLDALRTGKLDDRLDYAQ